MQPRRFLRRADGMRRRVRVVALVLPTVLVSAACGVSDSTPGEAPEPTATTTVDTSPDPDRTLAPDRRPEPVPSSSEPPAVTGEVPGGLLDEIIADAAERLDVEASEIVVVRAEAVTWPDGSLGCPEPGIVYTQALVPGYWVVLDADEQQLDYRVGRQGSFRLCENPTTTVPPGAGAATD
jgi:hypothetical protein